MDPYIFPHDDEQVINPPDGDDGNNNTPGKVTGGGWIDAKNKNASKSFGFEVQYVEGAADPTGQIEFVNHITGDKLHSDQIELLVIDQNNHTASIRGEASINGEAGHEFILKVSDIAEPGAGSDTFQLTVDGTVAGDNLLSGGNIQIHK